MNTLKALLNAQTSTLSAFIINVRKQKKRGESGKIYHVRNVTGRENLVTYGQTNERWQPKKYAKQVRYDIK